MKQKEILGSHFANAYECMKANELIESGQIRPVLWRTLGFDGVAEAHQLMLENKHLGKISILVGADAEGLGRSAEGPGAIHAEVAPDGRTIVVPWYATGFRADGFELALNEVAAASLRLRGELLRRLPLQRRSLPLPAVRDLRGPRRLGALLGRPAHGGVPLGALRLVSGAGALRLLGTNRRRRHPRAERAAPRAGRQGQRARRGIIVDDVA